MDLEEAIEGHQKCQVDELQIQVKEEEEEEDQVLVVVGYLIEPETFLAVDEMPKLHISSPKRFNDVTAKVYGHISLSECLIPPFSQFS